MPSPSISPEYDSQLAHTMVQLANDIYQKRSEAKRRFQSVLKPKKFHFLSRKGTQCAIASNDEAIFIVFRGTQVKQVEDILADIEVDPQSAFGGKVHSGFYRAYRLIRARLLNKLRLHGNKPIVVSGHSLGGALATLAALDLSLKRLPVTAVYTAGQPRVGDKKFRSAYYDAVDNRTFRFSHVDDVIPSIPPTKVPVVNFEYSHVGQKIYVVNNKTLTTQYKRSKNVFNTFADAGGSLAAHSCDGYEKAMQANIGFNPLTESKLVEEEPVVKIRDVKKALEDTGKDIEKGASKAADEIGDFAKDSGKKIAKCASKWF